MMLNWVIVFTQERALRQTFTYPKPTIETLKKSVNNECSKLIKTQERLSAVFIGNFGHISLHFLVLLLLTLDK